MIPQVFLKPQRAQPFYSRHPWVFAGAIDRVEGEPADGAVVELRSSASNFIALGIYNSQSKIRVRLYCWQPDGVLDREFWKSRLIRAISLRHDVLKLNGPQAAYRVCFSEADGLSGLIVDKYADWLSIQFTAMATVTRKDIFAELLAELLTPKGIYLRTEKGIGKLEGASAHDGLLWGEAPPADLLIKEHGLEFAINLAEGQKTGYYLDQRDNRQVAAKLAQGRRVMDAFSYTGGFGLACAKAGAKSVECVDASDAAIALAQANAARNGLEGIECTAADVFDHLAVRAQEGRKYDMIILDPPKFARDRKAVPEAIRGYRRLHTLAMKLLAPEGILVTCCCSGLVKLEEFEDVIVQTASDARRDMQILERRGAAPDHPVAASCRESSYLKCIIGRVA